MQSNLSRVFLFPAFWVAGLQFRDKVEPVFNFYLVDTHYTPATSGFSTLFCQRRRGVRRIPAADGLVRFAGAYRGRIFVFRRHPHGRSIRIPTCWSRGSSQVHPFRQSTPPGPRPIASIRCCTPILKIRSRNWTLNGDYGLTDGDPNPIRWFADLALVGTSPIGDRENDTVGIGYYHLGSATCRF